MRVATVPSGRRWGPLDRHGAGPRRSGSRSGSRSPHTARGARAIRRDVQSNLHGISPVENSSARPLPLQTDHGSPRLRQVGQPSGLPMCQSCRRWWSPTVEIGRCKTPQTRDLPLPLPYSTAPARPLGPRPLAAAPWSSGPRRSPARSAARRSRPGCPGTRARGIDRGARSRLWSGRRAQGKYSGRGPPAPANRRRPAACRQPLGATAFRGPPPAAPRRAPRSRWAPRSRCRRC
jgi:hypothetical protein